MGGDPILTIGGGMRGCAPVRTAKGGLRAIAGGGTAQAGGAARVSRRESGGAEAADSGIVDAGLVTACGE
ncbi:hypothetical protein GQ57_34990 [Burkholderia sp. MSh2]|nr:hypothetical protein GQ57_34990 [Burkholderia sp. MSh2]KFG94541.1 hypothetical protein GQ56_0125870 [Burkholderia paludis]